MAWKKLDSDAVAPGRPLSAFVLHRLVDNYQASAEHRLLAASCAFDYRNPIVIGVKSAQTGTPPTTDLAKAPRDRSNDAFMPWFWSLSAEARYLVMKFGVRVHHAEVSVSWIGSLGDGRWEELAAPVVYAPSATVQYYEATLDMLPLQRRGGGLVAVGMVVRSHESTSKFPDLLGTNPNKDQEIRYLTINTSITTLNPSHATVDPYRLDLEDGSGTPTGWSTQVTRASGTLLHVWPPLPDEAWAYAGRLTLTLLGRLDLYSMHAREVYGTPFAEGRRFPWEDPERIKAALSPGSAPNARTLRTLYSAGQQLFSDRGTIHSWGPRPFSKVTSTSEERRPWSSANLFLGNWAAGAGTEEALWSGRCNEYGESSYTGPSGVVNRGALDVTAILAPRQGPQLAPFDVTARLRTYQAGGVPNNTYVFPKALRWSPSGANPWAEGIWWGGNGQTNLHACVDRASWPTLGLQTLKARMLVNDLDDHVKLTLEEQAAAADYPNPGGAVAQYACLGVIVQAPKSSAWSSIGV